MRDFLNAPNGLPNQSPTTNERAESNPSQSPLVGRTVWKLTILLYFVCTVKLPGEIYVFITCRMYLIFLFAWPEIKSKRVLEPR
jgi:hypothetical protein